MTSTTQDNPGEPKGLDDLPGARDGVPDLDPIVALHAYPVSYTHLTLPTICSV